MNDKIRIQGARENNLKNVDLTIPRDKLVVFTGLSGSGKSSLAFDTIYAEGQRRYVESLSSYARQFLGQMDKPDVDSIDGLSPAISIDQKTTSKNPRSTVGTVTEIYDYLRLLWARVGIPHCPVCGKEIRKQTIDQIVEEPPVEYEVTYEAGEGGLIDGDMFQIIVHGGDGEGVMAEAEEEYIFVEWSDGVKTPYRVDKNVTSSFTVTAIFQYSENSDEEDGEGEGEEPSDKPGEEEEGEPQPSDKPGDPTDEPPSDEQQAGGRYEPQNQIRDGETYYGDEYEDAFNEAMEEVSQDGDLEDGQKDIIGDYFDAIQH
jgi:hypothetical protein